MTSTRRSRVRRSRLAISAWAFAGFACASAAWAEAPAVGSRVEVVGDADGGYRLLRNGKPFVVRGAGGEGSLEMLAACGGNTIRTWGVEGVEKSVDGPRMIDRAHELGIAVTIGLWLGHERHGFDYADAEDLAGQRRMVEAAVLAYRDHPALLCWGLGNEIRRN